jgi:hypothetical protein
MMIYTSRIDLPNGEVTYAYNHLFEQGIFLLWFTKFYNLRFVWYHFQFSLIWKYKQIKGIVCFDVFFFIKKTKKKTHHLKNTLFGFKIFWQTIIVFFFVCFMITCFCFQYWFFFLKKIPNNLLISELSNLSLTSRSYHTLKRRKKTK